MSYHPTVPFSTLRGLFGIVERHGVSRWQLMEAACIRSEELDDLKGRLSSERFERTCALAIDLTGDPALGVRWAELMMKRSFGPILEGLSHAYTLRHAFLLLAHFERFFTSKASFQLVEGTDEASVRVPTATDRPLPTRRLLAELSISWYVKLITTICVTPIASVRFSYDPPPYRHAYTQLFGATVLFGQPFTAVSFPQSYLDASRSVAGGQNGSPKTKRVDPRRCSVRLRELIVARAPNRLSMPEAARALGIGERSLRRRLAADGYSFKDIEFQALAEAARQKLFAEHRSIAETAHEMGFADTSAFHRAFKRWTGCTPSNFQADSARLAGR